MIFINLNEKRDRGENLLLGGGLLYSRFSRGGGLLWGESALQQRKFDNHKDT